MKLIEGCSRKLKKRTKEKGNINKNDELTQRRNGIQENKILAEHKEKAIKIALSGNLTPRAVYSLKQIYDLEIQTELLINYERELLKKILSKQQILFQDFHYKNISLQMKLFYH